MFDAPVASDGHVMKALTVMVEIATQERCRREEQRRRQLTLVIVGAGPTGVEMAGQVAELAQHTLRDSFRRIDPAPAPAVADDDI